MYREFKEDLDEWYESNNTTPLMVIGARQIGKTYIIDKFCKEKFDDYIYINLFNDKEILSFFEENINAEAKIKRLELFLNRKITEETVIFIDEIQESENIIMDLKYFCETTFPYKIICAGSLLGVKINRFKKAFPVGKVIIKNMYPMNFKEFLIAIKYEVIIKEIENSFLNNISLPTPIHEKLLEYYRLYICVGGMPASVLNLIENNLDIFAYNKDIVNSLVQAYIADLKKHVKDNSEGVKNEIVYKNIPTQLAKENKKFMYSKIDKNARKREYHSSLDWLISSNLIIPIYCVNKIETPLKVFEQNDHFKMYLNDTAILINMTGISYNKILLDDDFMYKGVLAENYVVNQLVYNRWNLYYWSKNQVAEIDLLLDKDEGVIPIEIKASNNTSSKSLNYYIEKNKPKYSIRISSKNFGFENNIKSVPLYAVFCIQK